MGKPKQNDGAAVVAAFGGLTATARAVQAPVSTVQGWLNTGRVPSWRFASIRDAAVRCGCTEKLPDALRLVRHAGERSAPRRVKSGTSGRRK